MDELVMRIKMGLISPNKGLVLSTENYSYDEIRKTIQSRGLASLLEVRIIRPQIPPDSRGLVLIRLRESVCEKKCVDKCGSREIECFGKCLYDCIETMIDIISEKLSGDQG